MAYNQQYNNNLQRYPQSPAPAQSPMSSIGSQPQTQQDVVSGDQYRYALTNFRIAHEKVESQRQQLEEQERQIAMLRERIAVLEGEDHGRADGRVKQGGTSVDDFSIKTAASKLEKLINRWAADVVRVPPTPLNYVRDAAIADITGITQEGEAEVSPMLIQNLLRHAMSETISEGIVNCLIVTNSSEANIQLTRIHEQIFARDPTVACVWRRQTFSAAVEQCSPEMSQLILAEQMPSLSDLFSHGTNGVPNAASVAILDAAYSFSRMLHGSRSSSGGSTDAFYKAFVPELGSVLYPRQIELVKRCVKSEMGELDRVGACVFPGLVKVSRGPKAGGGQQENQAVVRKAQVICECALGIGAQVNVNAGAQYTTAEHQQYTG